MATLNASAIASRYSVRFKSFRVGLDYSFSTLAGVFRTASKEKDSIQGLETTQAQIKYNMSEVVEHREKLKKKFAEMIEMCKSCGYTTKLDIELGGKRREFVNLLQKVDVTLERFIGKYQVETLASVALSVIKNGKAVVKRINDAKKASKEFETVIVAYIKSARFTASVHAPNSVVDFQQSELNGTPQQKREFIERYAPESVAAAIAERKQEIQFVVDFDHDGQEITRAVDTNALIGEEKGDDEESSSSEDEDVQIDEEESDEDSSSSRAASSSSSSKKSDASDSSESSKCSGDNDLSEGAVLQEDNLKGHNAEIRGGRVMRKPKNIMYDLASLAPTLAKNQIDERVSKNKRKRDKGDGEDDDSQMSATSDDEMDPEIKARLAVIETMRIKDAGAKKAKAVIPKTLE